MRAIHATVEFKLPQHAEAYAQAVNERTLGSATRWKERVTITVDVLTGDLPTDAVAAMNSLLMLAMNFTS